MDFKEEIENMFGISFDRLTRAQLEIGIEKLHTAKQQLQENNTLLRRKLAFIASEAAYTVSIVDDKTRKKNV